MSNRTNSKRSSMAIAIAAAILVMALGAPAFAASQPGQPAGGSASMNAPGGPVPVSPGIDGKGQGNNNGQGKGGKNRLELPRTWFHHLLGSVGTALKGAMVTAQAK